MGRSEVATASYAAGVMAMGNVFTECKNARTVRELHSYLLYRALSTLTMKQAISNFLMEEYSQGFTSGDPTRAEAPADLLIFRPDDSYRAGGVSELDGDLLLHNLLRLNLLRWEVPEVEDGETVHPTFVHLTELGLAVLKECNAGPSA